MAARTKITKGLVDKLQPGEQYWDTAVRGFGIRCQRQAKKYILKTRVNGKQRWFTIGEHGSPWTADAARKKAVRLLGDIHAGAGLDELRAGQSSNPTMDELCQRFLSDYAVPHKKASSVKMDEANIKNHVVPLLGRRLVSDITRSDIDAFKRAVRDGKTAPRDAHHRSGHRGGAVVSGGEGVANRCLALLSKMFNLAEMWDLRDGGSNPCRHVEKYKERPKERFLSSDEFQRLMAVLDDAENQGTESPFALAAIRLLIFTGARLGEILTLEWAFVDLDSQLLRLPDSKTDQKVIYLNTPAVAILSELPRIDGNPYVIAGKKAGAHLVNIRKPWYRLRAEAGLDDLRIHDLRHSFASFAVSDGLPIQVIGKLLGHKKSVTTERYAHLADDPLRQANEQIARLLQRSRPQIK